MGGRRHNRSQTVGDVGLERLNLILWRHAHAEEVPLGWAGRDADRALTAKGLRQAQQMAVWLDARLPPDCDIVVSPALRTRQTADALRRPYRLCPAIATGARVDDFLHAVDWPAASGTVLAVGHQPTLGGVAARLLGGRDGPLVIQRAAVWWFAVRDEGGTACVALRAVMSADLAA